MATNLKVVEKSFRLGCGRYIQENGAIRLLGEELERLGCHSPFILGGKTALSLTQDIIKQDLSDKGIEPRLYLYQGFCNPEHCEGIVRSFDFMECDAVIGIGGGNVMDAAKLCAAMAGIPVINIPTSTATCAAFTPLSVLYNEQGQTIGTRHHATEVNVILADMEILCRQPVHLLVAGVYDSLAKLIELRQRLDGQPSEKIDIGLLSSFEMSKFLYERLLSELTEVIDDVSNGRNTKRVYDTVYLILALTGVVSGLARGSNQTAIAHKIYEITRTLFPEQAKKALHGELVAIGLTVQLLYNGDTAQIDEFRQLMRRHGMPITLTEILPTLGQDAINAYYERIVVSSAMNGATEEEKQRLRNSLNYLIHE